MLDALEVGDQCIVYVISRQRDTGKINLALSPTATPRQRLHQIVADGRTPYQAKVSNISPFGTFFDIGTEQQALLSEEHGGLAGTFEVGQEATIYIVSKRHDNGKLLCSMHPDTIPRQPRRNLVADGRTPYTGVVTSVNPRIGAFLDLGCDASAVLPLRDLGMGSGAMGADAAEEAEAQVMALHPGEHVTVYVTQYSQHTGKVAVSLKPLSRALVPWKDIVADGQTRIDAVIVNKTKFGAFVDIGCSHMGMIPARDVEDADVFDSLRIGQKVPVYAYTKSRDTGKISLRLTRAPRPRERWEAILCDGQTSYEGMVIHSSWYGVFVDIGAETNGRLAAPPEGPSADTQLADLRPGDRVTVYVIEKHADSGKVTLSLDRRDTPLIHWKDIVVDGQTAYDGFVRSTSSRGAYVDIGCDRAGLLPRIPYELGEADASEGLAAEDLTQLPVGTAVQAFVLRRNPANGRLILSLTPSPVPRLGVEDALQDLNAAHRGRVYAFGYEWAFLDFGCEAGGALARSELPLDGCELGREVLVRATGMDDEGGRVLVTRARPPPPPRPLPSIG